MHIEFLKLFTFQSDWLHRYEACAEFAHKLLPSDFVSYVDGIAFAPESLSQVKNLFRQTHK